MPLAEFPITKANFDLAFKLPEFPDYYECQACMSLFPDILECPKCSGKACKPCSEQHSAKHKQQKPAEFPSPKHYKCLLCNNVSVLKSPHRFMKELLMSLLFKCKDCKGEIPYRMFQQHVSNGICK
jgi:hypothetical protein